MLNTFHSLQVHIATRGWCLIEVGGRIIYSSCSKNLVEINDPTIEKGGDKFFGQHWTNRVIKGSMRLVMLPCDVISLGAPPTIDGIKCGHGRTKVSIEKVMHEFCCASCIIECSPTFKQKVANIFFEHSGRVGSR